MKYLLFDVDDCTIAISSANVAIPFIRAARLYEDFAGQNVFNSWSKLQYQGYYIESTA